MLFCLKMKVFSFALAVSFALCCSADVSELEQAHFDLVDKEKFEKCLKEILKEGWEEHNIPPMETITIPNITLNNIDNQWIRGDLELKTTTIKEITNFNVKELNIDLTTLKVDATFILKNLDLDVTKYVADVELFDFLKVYGKGGAKIILTDLSVSASLKVVPLFTENVVLRLSNAKVEITGLLNDEHMSKIISKRIADLLPQLLEEHEKEITKLVTELVNSIIGNADPTTIDIILQIVDKCINYE